MCILNSKLDLQYEGVIMIFNFFLRKTKLKEMKSKNDELKKVKEKRKELMNGEGEEKGKAEDAQSKYIGGCQIEPYSLNTK